MEFVVPCITAGNTRIHEKAIISDYNSSIIAGKLFIYYTFSFERNTSKNIHQV